MEKKIFRILHVEDNEGDVLLLQEAFVDSSINVAFTVAEDGEEALSKLKQNDIKLDLIILDINLPKIDGLELLQIIKSDEKLRRIPVIMFTTSTSPNDINTSLDNYANSYIAKPVEMKKFDEIIENIERYWFKTNILAS